MKNILLCLAIVLLNFLSAHSNVLGTQHIQGNIECTSTSFVQDHSSNQNLVFEEFTLDISDDDINHSDKKHQSFGKIIYTPIIWVTSLCSDANKESMRINQYSALLRPALHIFLCVFRL